MAEHVSPIARLEYLVRRRSPNMNALRAMVSLSSRKSAPDTTQLREAVEAYRAELATLTLDEVAARYDDEQTKEREEIRQRLDREERERFFNLPQAVADYDHWSKAAHWTLDEAIALSFGRAPEVVRWDELAKFSALVSPFVTQYARRRDLATRAVTWKQLYDPVLPGIFLAWAKRTDIAVPPELTEAVQKRGVQVADWKSLHEQAISALKTAQEEYQRQISEWRKQYDQAKAACDAEHAAWLKVADEKNQTIAALQDRIASLEGEKNWPFRGCNECGGKTARH
jgi:hypothetical protein